MTLGTYRTGADLVVALDIIAGAITGSIAARIVKVAIEHPSAITGQGIDMTVTEVAATDDAPAGLLLSLTAEQTESLAGGLYAIDVRVDDGAGHMAVTDAPCFINLWPSPF